MEHETETKQTLKAIVVVRVGCTHSPQAIHFSNFERSKLAQKTNNYSHKFNDQINRGTALAFA